MTEPTAQVPVSLIERALKVADILYPDGLPVREELRALLSLHALAHQDPSDPDYIPPAAPPRIADMAPGTEFTSEGDGVPGVEHRFRVTGERDSRGVPYLFCTIHRTGARAYYVDPSTIRDVTPPPKAPEID